MRYFKHDGTYVDIRCAAGVHQGCPLGAVAFAAVLHVSLAMIMSRHHLFAYMDNVTLTGNVHDTEELQWEAEDCCDALIAAAQLHLQNASAVRGHASSVSPHVP